MASLTYLHSSTTHASRTTLIYQPLEDCQQTVKMPSTHDYYPVDCPFCNIANAYPAETSPVPRNPDPDLVSPQAHVILSTPHVMAFLDILPMAPGHILLTTRDHYKTVADLYNPETGADWASQRHASKSREDSRAIGEWLPLVSRALQKSTGIEDWNIVQNNGERAATRWVTSRKDWTRHARGTG